MVTGQLLYSAMYVLWLVSEFTCFLVFPIVLYDERMNIGFIGLILFLT